MSRLLPGAPLPYSKACDLEHDAAQLQPFYDQIDRWPDALEGQHPIRKWEYAMALRAIDLCDTLETPLLQICDVGGAGSYFWKVLRTAFPPLDPAADLPPILVVDPHAPNRVWRDGDPVQYWPETVEGFATHAGPGQLDVLTCISVIEHIKSEDLTPFIKAVHTLLKPDGLFFLTTDYWDSEGPDTAHFHWMRERIYNAGSMRNLTLRMREVGFRSFGDADWKFHGPQLYDYSVCSLAMVKR